MHIACFPKYTPLRSMTFASDETNLQNTLKDFLPSQRGILKAYVLNVALQMMKNTVSTHFIFELSEWEHTVKMTKEITSEGTHYSFWFKLILKIVIHSAIINYLSITCISQHMHVFALLHAVACAKSYNFAKFIIRLHSSKHEFYEPFVNHSSVWCFIVKYQREVFHKTIRWEILHHIQVLEIFFY